MRNETVEIKNETNNDIQNIEYSNYLEITALNN